MHATGFLAVAKKPLIPDTREVCSNYSDDRLLVGVGPTELVAAGVSASHSSCFTGA